VRDRFSIIGFTEAELGFIVAVLLFVAMSAHRSTVAPPAPQTTVARLAAQPTPVVSLRDYEKVQRQYSQEVEKNLALRRELDQRTNLRSRQKPSCIERHVAQHPVAEIQVTGRNQFRLEGETYDIETLLERLQLQLKQGARRGLRAIYSGKSRRRRVDDRLHSIKEYARTVFLSC